MIHNIQDAPKAFSIDEPPVEQVNQPIVVGPTAIPLNKSPSFVWEALLDPTSNDKWNPFHRSLTLPDGPIVGGRYFVDIHPLGAFDSISPSNDRCRLNPPGRFKIFHIDNSRYELIFGIEGIFMTAQWLQCDEDEDAQSCTYHQYDLWHGPMTCIVPCLLTQLRDAVDARHAALVKYCLSFDMPASSGLSVSVPSPPYTLPVSPSPPSDVVVIS